MREVLLHGSADEAFDQSAKFAKRLAESFGARLHVMYTVEDPLAAGWTAEVSAERLPEVHQAIQAEARERLARLIPMEDQERLGVELVLRTGPAAQELVQYTQEHAIDLAIVRSAPNDAGDVARALLDDGRCAVLVLR
ncbi:MAG: universal stress protein [Acidobacteria bacterium]|nr:universal stress protein [Acidobacteriota bacterium]MCA1651081.1 universal stress protein [Acidobacteriota bacterium]